MGKMKTLATFATRADADTGMEITRIHSATSKIEQMVSAETAYRVRTATDTGATDTAGRTDRELIEMMERIGSIHRRYIAMQNKLMEIERFLTMGE